VGGAPPHPDQGLPGQQPRPDHGLPSQKFLVAIVAVSAGGGLEVVGYTVVDPSLSVGYPLPTPPGGIATHPIAPGGARPTPPIAPGGAPPTVSQPIQPTPAPKT